MKKIYSVCLQLVCFILIPYISFSWNGDILVHPGLPSASHSMSAKANGTLYVSVPVDSVNGVYSIAVYQSTDNGDTWIPLSFPNAGSPSPVLKTKMVTTGSDSVFCLYLSGSAVNILNVESGIMGVHNALGVHDFDAAASPNGNAIYLFVNEPFNFDIRRYGTLDGGLTWNGNTALVTGNGYHPQVYMTGTRLMLNYYGPVLTDTSSSIIRAAFYDESVPGIITPGTFQDVATNTTAMKKEYMSVIYNNNVWFFFTEGNVQQVVKCRVSADNGATYGTEFILAGDAITNTYKIDAKHYSDATGGGCYLVYFADSILFPPPFDPMVITNATIANPSSFTPAVAFSDYTVTVIPSYHLPAVVPFANGSITDVGIAWVEDSGSQPMVYFDRLSNITAIQETAGISELLFQAFPNPVDEQMEITFSFPENCFVKLELYDATGKYIAIPKSGFYNKGVHKLEVSLRNVTAGVYTVRAVTDLGVIENKIIKR